MNNFYIHVPMKMMIAIAVVVSMLPGCKKEEHDTDIGWNYFPTEIGHWVIYEIDSTIYDDFEGDTDLYRYQVKEILESEFIDNQGRPSIRVERYKRMYNPNVPYDSIPWYLARVWSFTRTNSAGEKMEENQRFIRLSFPINDGVRWDGNVYNQIGTWNYKYKDVDEAFTIGSFAFDSTLTVEQKNDVNWLEHRAYSERYAKNVGLIEKNVIDVRDDTIIVGVPVTTRIHAGVVYNIKLVDYGPR